MLQKAKQLFNLNIDYKNRVVGFDMLRGVGILIVLYGHGRSKIPYFPEFNNFISVLGFWLMDLFFVQSGFLIGMILIKMYEREQTFNWKTSYNFWIRRWFRTLPNYYFVLFLTTILWAIFEHKFMFLKLKYIAYLVFFQSAITPTAPFLEESWTLCIEEWFYLLFPILLLVGNWLLVSLKLLPKNIKWNVFVSILILIFCPMALRFYAQSNKMFDWLDITRMTFFRLDIVGYGVLMAWINFYYKDVFSKNRFLFGCLSIISLTSYFILFYSKIIPNALIQTNSFYFTIIFIFSGFSAFSVTAYFSKLQLENSSIVTKTLTHISIISYSIYVFHLSVVMYTLDQLFPSKGERPLLENIGLFSVYVIVTLFFSTLVYKYFEHPMTELREKLKM
ncbi:MAG: acyltransferase [Bacteroidetes bacterium]|nr:acyltransferase [Bacteroidota bacterium]